MYEAELLAIIPPSLRRSTSFVYPIGCACLIAFAPLILLNWLHRLKKRREEALTGGLDAASKQKGKENSINVQFPDYILSPLVSFAAGALFMEAFAHTVTEILTARIVAAGSKTLGSQIESTLIMVLYGIVSVFSIERLISAISEAFAAYQKRKALKRLIKYQYRLEKKRRSNRRSFSHAMPTEQDSGLFELDDETFKNLEDEALEEDLDKAVNSDSTTDDQMSPRLDESNDCPSSDPSKRRLLRGASRPGGLDPHNTTAYKRPIKGRSAFESTGPTHTHNSRRSALNAGHSSQALLQALGTFVHCLTDGMTLTLGFKTSFTSGGASFLALAIHELPHKFGLYATYAKAGHDHAMSIKYLILGSLGTIIGAMGSLIAVEILGGDPEEVSNLESFQNLQLYAAGGMVYLGCTGILAELLHSSDDSHSYHSESASETADELRAEIKRLSESRNRESGKDGTMMLALKKQIYKQFPDILSSKSPLGIMVNALMQILFIFVGIKASGH